MNPIQVRYRAALRPVRLHGQATNLVWTPLAD
jgi:hypothetical protein